MSKRIYIFIFLAFLFFVNFGAAQEILTVDEAVQIALENNYQIKVASNELKIDAFSISPGNAGMLPQVNASITDNNSIQNSTQTRSDGNIIKNENAKNILNKLN